MQHHDRRTGRVAGADIDDVEGAACDPDHPALGGMRPLREPDSGLRDQRQYPQRRHDDHCHH